MIWDKIDKAPMTLVLVGVTQIDTMVTANCECGLIRELMVEFIGGRHDVWADTRAESAR